ncbi:hypothetical protein P170DRAFT_510115 [Aspergillus steynii IBT 23096]|uniref:Uncharacterized protein n=1 Tax=Aspergillus steynii IBT 23096 TaxID=1392250 RepID=A0A2I2G9N5_9EURO|nr:uncharacterized protein P170DRAFT_510115 [Aspergillus steynii IBT 23096]PLB49584.1 hypothetical protein P170DRAFT_510115 [Aspergillus steynii IBT 23096]
MRYENWDVLLFPESSKVPLQEFKTQCFVIKDTGSPGLVNPASHYLPQGNLGLLPVLTTFIPSIAPNTSFRVSVHSWEKPRPSRLMEGLLQPEDAPLFEIRIFIDGLCVSGSVFSQRTSWPHVIDLSSYVDKTGNQDTLRFPPFHQEILEQRYWDAGELYGRIRVVVSEGFARPHRTPPFERVKEVVAFSFQHAPLHVLECSSIAWPNAGMWTREPRLFKYNSGSGASELKEPEDTHTHSPTRHSTQQAASVGQMANPATQSTWQYKSYQGPPVTQWPSRLGEPKWAPQEPPLMQEAFIDPYLLDPSARHRGARPSWEDISMPDYVSSTTGSRALSSMTGISYEHSKHASIVAPIEEDAYAQLVQGLSPPKPLACGTHAPTNTPSSVAPVGSKPSAAAEARSASYTRDGSRSFVLKEISQAGTRNASESSIKSSLLPDPLAETTATSKLHASPNVNVKSRKEGMSQDNKENESAGETPRKETERLNNTPTRTVRRLSGNMDSPTEFRRQRSMSSARGEGIITPSKGESVSCPPVQELSAPDDLVRRVGLDELLDSSIQLMGSTAEVAAID